MRIIVIASVVLGGCVSTNSALSRSPSETVHSAKSVAEVSFCLANRNNVPALTAPDGAQIIQIKNTYGAVGMIFSVYPDGTGSRIEIRKPIAVSIVKHRKCY